MPADFEKCVKKGGRVRTVTGPNKQFNLEKNQYCHVCFLKGDMFKGEVKTKLRKGK